MQIRFTEAALSQLSVPKGARDCQFFDANLPGFGFRKFASGRASYFVKYKLGKQQRRLTLGPYIPGRLSDIRRKAAELLAEVRLGVDVQAERRGQPSGQNASLAEIIPDYLDARQSELSPEWHKEIAIYLHRGWAEFHERSIKSLERGELVRELDRIAKQRGAVTADHARKALSGLFSWAIDRGYVSGNPLLRLKRYAKGNERDRVLSLKELIAVWTARQGDDFGHITGLLILTLQRREEISELIWKEVDDHHDYQLSLPKHRTKNGRAHRIPLCQQALEILNNIPKRDGRPFLFGEGDRGFQGWSKSKARLLVAACRILNPELMGEFEARSGDLTRITNRKSSEKAAQALGYDSVHHIFNAIFPHWTLHDLRRTGGTLINEFGLGDPHIVEAILNHVSGPSKGGVAGIYNRAQYEDQKRHTLTRWDAFWRKAVTAYDTGGFPAVELFERQHRKILRGEPSAPCL